MPSSMSSPLATQHLRVVAPGPGVRLTVSTSPSSAVDLSAFVGDVVLFKADVKTHVVFGATSGLANAAATDFYLAADQSLALEITNERKWLKVIGTGTGNLHYVAVSE